MRKLLFLSIFAFALVFGNIAFRAENPKPKLKITNKTDSRIDEVHIGDSGDLLDDDEVLMPGESVTVEFSGCEGMEDEEVEVLLVFVDGEEFSFDDTVCDGDFAWDITNDGDHSN